MTLPGRNGCGQAGAYTNVRISSGSTQKSGIGAIRVQSFSGTWVVGFYIHALNGDSYSKGGIMEMKDKIDLILKSPSSPGWLQQAAKQCLLRDPIHAVNEATFLLEAMRERLRSRLT